MLTIAVPTGALAQRPASAGRPSARQQSLDEYLTLRRKEAVQLAQKREYAQAIAVLGACKERVEAESRSVRVQLRTDPNAEAYRKELGELGRWLRQQVQQARQKQAGVGSAVSQFQTRKAELDKKYNAERIRQTQLSSLDRLQAARAPFRLKLADLDEQSAAYYEALGDRDHAMADRMGAGLARLEAFQDLKQVSQARAAAERLLALNPPNAGPYDAVGRFYQGRGEFQAAAGVWKRVIAAIEGGKILPQKPSKPTTPAPVVHPMLEQFYRQLAFCLLKLNRNAESQVALQQAAAVAARAGGGAAGAPPRS